MATHAPVIYIHNVSVPVVSRSIVPTVAVAGFEPKAGASCRPGSIRPSYLPGLETHGFFKLKPYTLEQVRVVTPGEGSILC